MNHDMQQLTSRIALATLSVMLSWSAGYSLARADVPVSEAARAHFDAGTRYLEDSSGTRDRDAYRELSAAYAASPSWRILGNLGIAASRLERDGEAIAAFDEYLKQGAAELPPEEQQVFQQSLAELRASSSPVRIEADQPGVMLEDERLQASGPTVVNQYGPVNGSLTVALRAGRHRLTASAKGYSSQVWDVDVRPGSREAHAFSFGQRTPPNTERTTKPIVHEEQPVGADSGAAASVASTRRPDHQGLLFRANIGVGGSMTDDAGAEINGLAGLLSLDLGYGVADRLAVHGRLSGQTVVNPSLSYDGEDYGETSTSISYYLLGGGATYYASPNLYLSGVVGLSSGSVEIDGTQVDLGSGFGLQGDVGYEWATGKEWGVGVSGRAEMHSISYDGGSLSVLALGALFSATYY